MVADLHFRCITAAPVSITSEIIVPHTPIPAPSLLCGGLPIIVDGQVIGGIGVSFDTPVFERHFD
jgi:uncharacterized protein GlcG (DUF336 family)